MALGSQQFFQKSSLSSTIVHLTLRKKGPRAGLIMMLYAQRTRSDSVAKVERLIAGIWNNSLNV